MRPIAFFVLAPITGIPWSLDLAIGHRVHSVSCKLWVPAVPLGSLLLFCGSWPAASAPPVVFNAEAAAALDVGILKTACTISRIAPSSATWPARLPSPPRLLAWPWTGSSGYATHTTHLRTKFCVGDASSIPLSRFITRSVMDEWDQTLWRVPFISLCGFLPGQRPGLRKWNSLTLGCVPPRAAPFPVSLQSPGTARGSAFKGATCLCHFICR